MQTGRTLAAACGFCLVVAGVAGAQEHGAGGGPADKPRDGGAAQPKTMTAKVGQPAPDFALLDCTGKKITLADFKDKLVVLQWVNQQCPWSVGAIPLIKDLQKKHEGNGVVWLGVDSTHDRSPEDDAKYIKDKALGYTILMDGDGRVGRAYGAKTTPHLFVINKGKLVYMGALNNNQQGDKKPEEVRNYVGDAVKAALEGKDAPLAETTPWGCSVKYKSDAGKDARSAAAAPSGDKK